MGVTAKQIREMKRELKRVFPGWKFQVTKTQGNDVSCIIMEGPIDFGNQYSINKENNYRSYKPTVITETSLIYEAYKLQGREELIQIFKILNGEFTGSGKHSNSSRILNSNWWVFVSQGVWNKPFVWTNDIRKKIELI